MSENWNVQISLKTPAGALINLRGDTVGEVRARIDDLEPHVGAIASIEALLSGAATAAAALTDFYPEATVSPVASVQQATPSPPSNGKTCAHGPMVWRTGSSAKGPWGGHFCPLPKERKSEQCDVIWDRSYGK